MSDKQPAGWAVALVAEIERVYELLNEKLFDGKLKPVNITVGKGSDYPKKKVSVRYFTETGSLVIGGDFPKLEYAELPCCLLHEMIHIRNHQEGIVDVTTNQYHNKAFLNAALDVGFVVIKHKTQGWSITTTIYPRNVVEKDFIMKPLKEATQKRDETFALLKFDKAIFKQTRAEIRQQTKQEKPQKTYFLKYICNCPPPHNSIRSGRRPDGPNALNIHCMNCRSAFVCVTPLGPETDEQ